MKLSSPAPQPIWHHDETTTPVAHYLMLIIVVFWINVWAPLNPTRSCAIPCNNFAKNISVLLSRTWMMYHSRCRRQRVAALKVSSRQFTCANTSVKWKLWMRSSTSKHRAENVNKNQSYFYKLTPISSVYWCCFSTK